MVRRLKMIQALTEYLIPQGLANYYMDPCISLRKNIGIHLYVSWFILCLSILHYVLTQPVFNFAV